MRKIAEKGNMKGKFYIENLGCAKNQVDAEVIANRLIVEGLENTAEPGDADYIIVNTCGFIEDAKKQSVDTFFALHKAHPNAKIIVSGCLAQRYGSLLKTDLPEVDAIFGNRNLNEIAGLISSMEKSVEKDTGKKGPVLLSPEYPDPEKEFCQRSILFGFPGSAYLKISEGCNHRCGYCAIPVIRGDLRSRPMHLILEELDYLVSEKIHEINIVAQDLAAYGSDWDGKSHFVELLEKICERKGDFKVRMLYIHPDAFPDGLLDLMQKNDRILHYFDIPFQHASEHLLRPMKRTGNALQYEDLVRKIREVIPDAVIRTTLMLGFPGDTEEDFNVLCEFVQKCRFNWMGSFTYSLEEDTYAYTITTQKTHNALHKKAVKWQKTLQSMQESITSDLLEDFIGNEYDVLIEELVEGEELAIGRIYSQAPEVDGLTVVMGRDMEAGKVYRCGITKVSGIDLEAVKI